MSRLSETLYEECYESIKFECETRMIFVGHKNVKERVNFINYWRVCVLMGLVKMVSAIREVTSSLVLSQKKLGNADL